MERLFCSCYFSDRVTKVIIYFGLFESYLHFSRRDDQIDTGNGRKFSFSYVDMSDMSKCKFIFKNTSLECILGFHLFLRRTQI